MNNFKPGGIRHRSEHIGGRPKSDADYRPKKRFDNSPRRDDRGGRGDNKEVQLFKATCTTCGKPCEVPFRPNGTKPVLCRDCFASKNPATSQSSNFSRVESTPVPDTSALKAQIATLEVKVSAIMDLLKSVSDKVESLVNMPAIAALPKDEIVSTKVAKPKAKKAVKKSTKKVK